MIRDSLVSQTLVAPGLLGPVPATCREELQTGALRPLARLLGRADQSRTAEDSLESTLFNLFGWDEGKRLPIPIGPVRRLAETGLRDAHVWMCADPVHLRVDRDQALVFDACLLEIQESETRQLAREFNRHFSDQGWLLEIASPTHWYIRTSAEMDAPPAMLSQVIGRDLHQFLPEGDAGRRWRGLLNEVQMLFHGSDVNQQREERGLPAINGIWIWGGGRLPEIPAGKWGRVASQELLAPGLAALTGVEVCSLPTTAQAWLAQGDTNRPEMIVVTTLRDAMLEGDWLKWNARLNDFGREWIVPLVEALQARRIGRLEILPCNGSRYHVTAGNLRRFWRRPLELNRILFGD